MLSPRVSAHLGLGAASSVCIYCLCLLHSGASEAKYALRSRPADLAPGFVLQDASGSSMSLSACRGQIVVLCFSSIGCPVSNDYRQRLADLTKRYSASRRAIILQINLGRGLPSASKSNPLEVASTRTPAAPARLLMDPNCEVGGLYAVDLTPTFFVIDSQGVIRYRGSFDDNRNAAQVKSHYCEDALEDVLHDRPVAEALTAPFGCAISR
jgi:hypothetical protein